MPLFQSYLYSNIDFAKVDVMNYRRYYLSADKVLARSWRVFISGYLLPDHDELIINQNLHLRAIDQQEAYEISQFIRDDRLNQLHTTTLITNLNGQSVKTWESGPGKSKLYELYPQEFKAYSVVIVREAGSSPITCVWSDQAEDRFTIHAESEQEAHVIADFVCALPFNGQVKRTIINGSEHFDERY